MRYEIIENFKIRTSKGELELYEGQIIKLPEDKAEVLLQAGKIKKQAHYEQSTAEPIWKNPYPQCGISEARKYSLSVVMDAMLEQAVIDFDTSDHRYTPEVLQVENEAKSLYFTVLDGRKTLADFRQIVDRWQCIANTVG